MTRPREKRSRQERPSSSEGETGAPSNNNAIDAILHTIMERLEKLEILSQINQRLGRIEEETSSIKEKVNGFEKSLASLNLDVEELKLKVADKVDNARVLALEHSIEDLVNRSKRNNLVFFNVPEKSENGDCVAFIQHFISAHMGITNDEGHKLEIERAHRTPPGKPVDGKPPDLFTTPSCATQTKCQY